MVSAESQDAMLGVKPLFASEYYYARPCPAWKDQGLCSDDCDCYVSWPHEDPLKWRSLENACRCLPKQMAPEAYTYRKPCSSSKGTCNGCDECMISWPTFDERRWQSAERMCRCKPAELPADLAYGEACPNLYDGECGADCSSCVEATDAAGDKTCRCAPGESR